MIYEQDFFYAKELDEKRYHIAEWLYRNPKDVLVRHAEKIYIAIDKGVQGLNLRIDQYPVRSSAGKLLYYDDVWNSDYFLNSVECGREFDVLGVNYTSWCFPRLTIGVSETGDLKDGTLRVQVVFGMSSKRETAVCTSFYMFDFLFNTFMVNVYCEDYQLKNFVHWHSVDMTLGFRPVAKQWLPGFVLNSSWKHFAEDNQSYGYTGCAVVDMYIGYTIMLGMLRKEFTYYADGFVDLFDLRKELSFY